MKIISIAAVTAGGKTTIVNELKKQIPNTKSLHFDEYSFEGEVDDFYTWTKQGADYNVWNLKPLIKDILEIKKNSDCGRKKCLSPAKKYKLYKSSINKSLHFVQRRLSSTRGQRVTAHLNLS